MRVVSSSGRFVAGGSIRFFMSQVAEIAIFSAAAVALAVGMLGLR